MITPVEILGKELRKGFGYKSVDVDELLEDLAKNYETLYKSNDELREQVASMTESLAHYKEMEGSLKRALVLAEKTSEETLRVANKEARNMETDATRKAEKLVNDAKEEVEKMWVKEQKEFATTKAKHKAEIDGYKQLIRKLESDYCSYKTRMLEFINSQLDVLRNPVYELEFQIPSEGNHKKAVEKKGQEELYGPDKNKKQNGN